MTNKQTPSEQIAQFIERHPGEWAQWSREGTRYPVAYATLRLHSLPNVCVVIGHEGSVVSTRRGGEAGELLPATVKPPHGADLLTKISLCVADSLQIHGGTCDTLPLWLADPVRRQLRTRAGYLLTLSDTPTTSPEISPDSQAIEQVRNRLKATTDLNGEQALGVLEDLRRILGVTQ